MRMIPVLLALALLAPAQDVGMGRRRGTDQRLETPYTTTIATPHVKWFHPLPGGPVRVLAVPTVREGRTLAELMQRLQMDVTTVSIDPAFDTNKWTMAFGPNYGARAERGDLSLIYSYLEQELTSPKPYDVILLQLSHGWETLTPASREALLRRVGEGAGLVLVRPFASEISPLIPAADPPKARAPYDAIEPASVDAGKWSRVLDHWITRAIPVEAFPSAYLQEYVYRAGEGAAVLVRSATGNPIVAAKPYGKGRVIAFGYRNAGLSWNMPMKARGFVGDAHWEYFYAMLCRALVYAAGREPNRPWHLRPPQERTAASRIRAESGREVASRAGQLPPGRYFKEAYASDDFEVTEIDIASPDVVTGLRVDKETVSGSDRLTVSWQASRPATVELSDGYGRVIARAQGSSPATLTAGRPLTHSGFVTVTAGSATARIPIRFAASSREWSDYEIIMPWYGPNSYQPWIPAVDEQFRALGITTLSNPERNFRLIASAGLHDTFGVYFYRNQKYAAKKKAYAETGDKRHLVRDVVLQDPAFEPNLRRDLEKNLKPLAPLRPLAYYLADESSLTSYTDPFDVDWSPVTLAAFRKWLQGEYASLDDLNRSWGTGFRDWDAVNPMTAAEAQKHGNYAPWGDHRLFMERDFVRVLGRARDMVREIDPGALASISGTQVPTAHNGCDWFAIDQVMDYLQPYSGGNQDQMHYLFRPGIKLTGFTGYGSIGDDAHAEQWRRLFHGHTGASIFWHYTILNPDLTFSEQGRELAEVFGRIQSGIGRLFMNSTVREDGVAIHFSMASIRGAWITDGKIGPGVGNVNRTSAAYTELVNRRQAWVKELQKQGLQFRFLATPQIEAGELAKYKALILPYSIALSDRELAEIAKFTARGGMVYADEQTGRMDERLHIRESKPRIDAVVGAPRPVGVAPQYEAGAEALVTVRDFGSSRLTGVLPEKTARIRSPRSAGVTYDLLRGGPAAAAVEVSPRMPGLFVERAVPIAKLAIGGDLTVTLTDAKGGPVDRSVVRAQVVDPSGKLVRYYSGNVTVENGRARITIPFAWNDARGRWTIRARDVVSGLTAQRTVTR